MKTIWTVLLLLAISLNSSAQDSKENRLNKMYQATISRDFDKLVAEYIYDGFKTFIGSDSLKSLITEFYNPSFNKKQLISYSPGKQSKIVVNNNIQYYKVSVERKYIISLNKTFHREMFLIDSINTVKYYDSLKIAMQNDTVYQNRLLKDTIDMDWIYESEYYKYYALENHEYSDYYDSYESYLYTKLDEMYEIYSYNLYYDPKSKLEVSVDYTTMSILLHDPHNTAIPVIGILNPEYSNEWKFIDLFSDYENYYNFLIPEVVLKQLKVKNKVTSKDQYYY